jgi:PAS domain S-box-containing protein
VTRGSPRNPGRVELEGKLRLLNTSALVMGHGVVAFDAALRVTHWSRPMTDIFGLPELEVLGRSLTEVLPFFSEDGDDAFRAALAGRSTPRKGRTYLHGSGKTGVCDVFYLPVLSNAGDVLAGAAIVRDITEQRLAEEALQETELRFKNMADASPVLLWMADADGLCTFFNQTWLTFTGRTMDQEWGIGWSEAVHPEDFQACIDHYVASFNDRHRFQMEYRLRRADGVYRWILDRGVPRFTPEGKFAGFIGSCVDITDSKTLEGELRGAVRDRDEFLSIAAHELRTPLTSLQLQMETLSRAVARIEPVNEKLAKNSVSAMRQTRRLMSLVEQLLDLSHLTMGRLGLLPETVDLVAVINDVTERFSPIARDADCSLDVSLPVTLSGYWDRARIEQVLSNLLSNAVKYGRGRPIAIRLSSNDGFARLTVKDHGVGISESDQARIFERFERAVPTQNYGGFGLGLWIARELVEAHGGTISVASVPTEGSTFTVVLPIQRPG